MSSKRWASSTPTEGVARASRRRRAGATGRERLLDRIDAVLVAGALAQTRGTDAWMELRLHPRVGGDGARPPAGSAPGWGSLSEALEAAGGRIVLVGAPGAGKTAMALELVSWSLERSRADEGQPVPVLLDLVEWRPGWSIERWILQGLRDHYGVPVRFGAQMLGRGELLVIADSLDAVPELARADCTGGLEDLLREAPGLGVVVVSRTEEYERMPAPLPWPTVEVASPTGTEAMRYARRAGIAPERAGLTVAGSSDVPTTPQVLRLLAVAGDGTGSDGPLHDDAAPPLPSAIARVAVHRWLERGAASTSEALLRWIAGELRDKRWWACSLGRLAEAGPSRSDLRRAQRALLVTITTLVGLLAGVSVALTVAAARRTAPSMGSWLVTAALVGVVVALADSMITDARLIGGDPEDPGSSDRPATAPAGWPVRVGVMAAIAGGAVGLRVVAGEFAAIVTVGVSVGALIGLTSRRLPWRDSVRWSWRSFLRKLLVRTGVAAVAGLLLAPFVDPSRALLLALGLVLGLGVTSASVAGFKRRIAPLPPHRSWFLGRWRVALGGIAIFGAAGLAAGLVATAIGGEGGEATRWLTTASLVAIAGGVTAAALAGALYGGLEWLERWALSSVLVRAGIAPRPPSPSLEELSDGMLLCSAGAGVAFIHRPVAEVLADGQATSGTVPGGPAADTGRRAIVRSPTP